MTLCHGSWVVATEGTGPRRPPLYGRPIPGPLLVLSLSWGPSYRAEGCHAQRDTSDYRPFAGLNGHAIERRGPSAAVQDDRRPDLAAPGGSGQRPRSRPPASLSSPELGFA